MGLFWTTTTCQQRPLFFANLQNFDTKLNKQLRKTLSIGLKWQATQHFLQFTKSTRNEWNIFFSRKCKTRLNNCWSNVFEMVETIGSRFVFDHSPNSHTNKLESSINNWRILNYPAFYTLTNLFVLLPADGPAEVPVPDLVARRGHPLHRKGRGGNKERILGILPQGLNFTNKFFKFSTLFFNWKMFLYI